MNRIIIIVILLGGLLLGAKAQDIHFSQFYNMPLALNPSLAGHFEGTYRIKGIYRNQWNSITKGGVYATPGISVDANFSLRKQKKPISLGTGIIVMNDKTGGGDFNNTHVMAAVALHGAVSKKTYLSIGFQGGLNSRRLNTQNLTFTGDLSGQGNAENFKNTSLNLTELRSGATIAFYPSDRKNLKFGLAGIMRFGSKNNRTFLNSSEDKIPARLIFHGEGSFLNKSRKLRWMPHFLFMTQANVLEINTTLNLGYKLTPDVELVAGAGYRFVDAAMLNLGFNYKGFQMLATYDFNVSKLTPATNANGAYEVSLGYIGSIKEEVKPELPCVRFF